MGSRILVVARLELEIGVADDTNRAGDVDHDPVDAVDVASVVVKCRRLARPERHLVGCHGIIVVPTLKRIVPVRVVVEDVTANNIWEIET